MNNNQTDNQPKKPIALILIFFAVVVIVGLGGYYLGTISSSAELNRYKTALDEFYPPLPDEIFAISGTIKTINENIILEIASLEERTFPGEEPKIEERIINLNSETQIVEQSFIGILEGEMFEMQDTPIALSNLNVGDMITVEANENIKTKKEFTASKIISVKF